MALLTPLFLALGLLALPILVLYMLKLRRREVEISSTLLWQLLLRDREANAPWQRLKRSLLLVLQLLLLALLALALARPFVRVPAVASGTLVVLLDASASMQALDETPSRFALAQAAARQLVQALPADSQMTLILVGQQPEVLASATRDHLALQQAVAEARPGEGAADWEAAFALAAGAMRAARGGLATVVVISDGGLPADLPPLPGEVRYVPVGRSADNLAIEALALRLPPVLAGGAAAGGPELFGRLANRGDQAREVIFALYRDGQLVNAQTVSLPAGESADVVMPDLPPGAAVYQARLARPVGESGAGPLDELALDDTAWAVYQPAASARVLLVSPQNIFLEQVLAAFPRLQPFRLNPGAPLPADPFDVFVLDGVFTGTLPSGNLLLVNPPASALLEVGGTFTNTALARTASNHPLLRSVDWSGVHVRQARRVQAPAWARVLVEAEGGPLVLAGETAGRRVAILTFDLHESDLPLQVAYPILMSNLLNYLSPPQLFSASDSLRPGDPLSLPAGSAADQMLVADPAGQLIPVPLADSGRVFAQTSRLGVYSVYLNQALAGSFAVNLFSAAESGIRPAPAIRVGRAEVAAAPPEETGQLEIWPWLAAAAFGLLLVEWWVYQRGTTLPEVSGWRGLFRRRRLPSG